jgi:predicted PurR-regulated permease PerM
MFVLGVLPLVGAGLVWVPVAAVLALDGRWLAAVALVAWGLAMAGPVGNVIYGWAAGNRMRLHPVPVLIAYAGGLTVFGFSGMVLGPAVLAVTVALVDVWKLRAGGGQLLEGARPAGDGKTADHAAGNGSVSAGAGSTAGVG